MITTEQKIAFEQLGVAARQFGIPEERFREIAEEVKVIARGSLTWGHGKQLAELRRRIIKEIHERSGQ